jgi:stearoyl-CoA desaturase (delta-9 desaturase)
MASRKLNWTNIVTLGGAHLMAAGAVAYMAFVHFSWWTLGLGFLWSVLCGLAVTGGYHRLFAHRAYRGRAGLRAAYLCFGAAAVQNSALNWALDHRIHHAHTDTDVDPYSVRRGFWWAHVGWVLFDQPKPSEAPEVDDLAADPLIRLQDRYYIPLAIVFGAALPAALGLLWGDPLGAFLVAGFLRLVLQWHATFSVNSVAHLVGRRPFCSRSTARDCFWTALYTLGEGYHNFHHRFQNDYRNGVRWYHFDPTKWFVWGMSKLGVTSDLKRVPGEAIRRARKESGAAVS